MAARADYAEEAAAAALTAANPSHIDELAGDTAWPLGEFAAELSRQAGKAVA